MHSSATQLFCGFSYNKNHKNLKNNLEIPLNVRVQLQLQLQSSCSSRRILWVRSSMAETGFSSKCSANLEEKKIRIVSPEFVPAPPDRQERTPHSGNLGVQLVCIPFFFHYSSMAENEPFAETSEVAEERKKSAGVSPVYVPVPRNRELRTPHSGYHFDGSTRQFFEGWYFKVSIPEKRQTFCFIYSIENPAFPKKLTPAEEEKYGRRSTGAGVQILGAYDKYISQYSEESHNFWGRRHELVLGNTFKSNPCGSSPPPANEVFPEEFNRRVDEGFQVTPLWNQGFIRDDGRSDNVETVKTARWEYSTRPVYGWGNSNSKQKSTAGWLAAFPVFEPHWQVCMAGGLSTGWIEWDGERFEFENAPSYSEKNWGAGFPKKWFWIQCNVFEGVTGEVSVTSAGGLRALPGGRIENAALVGVHYEGVFYEFVPWNGDVEWEISPWGYWKVSADNGSYKVELEGRTEDKGVMLKAPTPDTGLIDICRDTCSGQLKLHLWERTSDGSKGKVILEATSNMAALEVGGGPWTESWVGRTKTPAILSAALRVPLDMELVSNVVPFFNPPGL